MQRLFILPESHDQSRRDQAIQLAFSLSKHVKTALFLEGRMGDQAATDKTPFDVISVEHPAILSSIGCLSAVGAASTLNAFIRASQRPGPESESFMAKNGASKGNARELILNNVRYVSTLMEPDERDEFERVCREIEDSTHGGIPNSLRAALSKWVARAAESLSPPVFESVSAEINGFFHGRFHFQIDEFKLNLEGILSILEAGDSFGLVDEVSKVFHHQNSFREAYMAYRIAQTDATVGVLNIGSAHSERSYLVSLLDHAIDSIRVISPADFEKIAK